MQVDIQPIPDGSFAGRLYAKPETLDYCGMFLVEQRAADEYELCKWIVRQDAPRDYLGDGVSQIIEKILAYQKHYRRIRFTGTFEKRKYRIYKRYFKRHGFEIPIIKTFSAEYNGIMGEFNYVEIIKHDNSYS